jgi:hypothetical protein
VSAHVRRLILVFIGVAIATALALRASIWHPLLFAPTLPGMFLVGGPFGDASELKVLVAMALSEATFVTLGVWIVQRIVERARRPK